MNTYAYVGGNPLTKIERSGTIAWLPLLGAAAAARFVWDWYVDMMKATDNAAIAGSVANARAAATNACGKYSDACQSAENLDGVLYRCQVESAKSGSTAAQGDPRAPWGIISWINIIP